MPMRSDFYVYCWTNTVDGKQYIGKGRAKRATEHMTRAFWKAEKEQKNVFYRAVRKHGPACFTLEYIGRDLAEDIAFALEKAEIAARDTLVPNGYNLTLGGEGASGYVPTPEQCAASSKRFREIPRTEEWKGAISATHLAKWADPVQLANRVTRPRKLSKAQATNIRILLQLGAKGGDLARWFGTTTTRISKIKLGKVYVFDSEIQNRYNSLSTQQRNAS